MSSDMIDAGRAGWQVPSFRTDMWSGRRHRWCVMIPVINEGLRIGSLLSRMRSLAIADIADIIIVDGGSTDGSLAIDALREQGVRGLLVKTGPGRLSAQLRCGYAFALDEGYEGIVTIDGNDKDDPEAIPRFVQALEQGIDFVQGSRFVAGGVAENTPLSRHVAIRGLHAPLLSFSSQFHWTDTTQGFRAYSRRMLLDPAVAPFRSIFVEYELLAYLSHRVPLLGYRCVELPTIRRYPKNEIPTKISPVRGSLKVFQALLLACCGIYDAAGPSRNRASSTPILLLCAIGFIYGILAYFPGWMSPDSFISYVDSTHGIYQDWQPVMMGRWWSVLNRLYDGPALMLIQNLLLYWAGWALLALACRPWAGRIAWLLPLAGFWPGLTFPLGQIWKDISFAAALLFCWALLRNAAALRRGLRWRERIALMVLLVFAAGIKSNGIVALPFLLGYWVAIEQWHRGRWWRYFGLAGALTLAIAWLTVALIPRSVVVKTFPFQYTQTYDLLAISIASPEIVLPDYVTRRVGATREQLGKLYFVGGNNVLFYGTDGKLATVDKQELKDLDTAWIAALKKYPAIYLQHRYHNMLSLLRIGETAAAYIANPRIDNNSYGFSFRKNEFSNWLEALQYRQPWIFFPWIYTAVLLVAGMIACCVREFRLFSANVGLSAIAFLLPHFFVAPAYDYRYLYYLYICSAILLFLAVLALLRGGKWVLARVLL